MSDRDQRRVEDLGVVVYLGCLGHADLPGGIPTHAPMMPQSPVDVERLIYSAPRT